jgi:hypothetical protein
VVASLWTHAGTVLRDAGAPALLGIFLGSALSYYFGKRLLDDQARRQRDLLPDQVRREAADEVEKAVHRLETAVKQAQERSAWGQLHNQWQDDVMARAARLHDSELEERLSAIAYAIFLCIQYEGPGLNQGVLVACDNAREGLIATLSGRPLPKSFFPTKNELHHLIWDNGGPHFDGYREILANPGALAVQP